MKTRLAAACAIPLAIFSTLGTPASAHRLDEYLQATTISVDTNRIQAHIRLTPGVAVFPGVFAMMDADANGVLSETEQQSYANRVLGDLSLTIDGKQLQPRLVSWKFGKTAEMKEGRSDIQLDFGADVPQSVGSRKIVFENHHQSRIAVYLVNCLVPRDPNIQVTAQKRNYLQSRYELDYTQTGVSSASPSVGRRSDIPAWLTIGALLLLMPLVWLWQRGRSGKAAQTQENGASSCETVSPKGREV